jgi:hypothetical protein
MESGEHHLVVGNKRRLQSRFGNDAKPALTHQSSSQYSNVSQSIAASHHFPPMVRVLVRVEKHHEADDGNTFRQYDLQTIAKPQQK